MITERMKTLSGIRLYESFFKKAMASEFYTKPQMLGHKLAAEAVEELENISKQTTGKSKKFFEAVVSDSNDWHYYANETHKKWRTMLRAALKDVKNGDYWEAFIRTSKNHPRLKSSLMHAVEIGVYKYDKERWLERYKQIFGSYGMDAKSAEDRFNKYHQDLMNKNPKLRDI